MAEFEGYDIIGDVHGCADDLEALLVKLGYEINTGTVEYRHPDRQAVFVGDLIDRGDGQLRVLQVAKDMVDAGSARIVMGNHEFNALGYHYEHPAGSGKYLRAHTEKNTKQHRAFLEQVTGEDRRRYLDWFATMPLWLDLDGLRVVHACWHKESMDVVEEHCGSNIPFTDADHLVAAHDKGDSERPEHPLYRAIENLLKGPEISLVDHGQPKYRDKDGVARASARIRWWNSAAGTLRDIAELDDGFKTTDGVPYPQLPQLPQLPLPDATSSFVYTGEVPVFYGHYWRKGSPERGKDFTERTACVDFSAAKNGAMTAYRWSGEATIRPENYVQVR